MEKECRELNWRDMNVSACTDKNGQNKIVLSYNTDEEIIRINLEETNARWLRAALKKALKLVKMGE